MRISIFLLLLIVLSVASVAPAGILFWTTFTVMRETIKDLYDDRANFFFSVAAERIDPILSPAELSREIDSLGIMAGGNGVVLDAEGMVVAHPLIGSGIAEPGLPAQVDPVLARLMSEAPLYVGESGYRVWVSEIDGEIHGLGMQTLKRPRGWQFGVYGGRSDLADLIDLKSWLYSVCAAVLLIGIVIAFILSRKISRPLRGIALVARNIGRFELDIEPLPPSRLAEVDQTDSAMNSMVSSLRWFARYVPREVVRRLMVEPGAGAAEERELTILFTDLAGFTNMSEAMTPMQVADFINHHFALVSDCIEREGGTIDKYIGDAVMAFWGAPQPLLDHAVRGCRAALAIRRAIEADNTKRRQQGMESVHVRIGLHMGPVVVGNIGSERRVNYSIIGDSVNVAARLESQGKELGDPSQEVGILASDSVLEAAGLISEAVEVGSVPLRGRTQAMRVYRL
ncbi:MAG: adenylate/guanylate cyclase domain-containing protein [Hyphomicrobiaceae bacterium]